MEAQLSEKETLTKIIDIFVADPDEGEAIAREFGLWDSLYETLFHPLQLNLCRANVNRFIEYVFVDPETREYLEQQDFHEEWQDLISSHNRVLIAAPRGHGKCLVSGTRLTLAGGARQPVESIPIGETIHVVSWTPEAGYIPELARVWQSTVQPCYRITTKSGRTTAYSEEHPCWTGKGWVATKDLETGMQLAVARNQPEGHTSYCKHRAWLLGALLGDGGLTIPSRVNITCEDTKLLSLLSARVKACGFSLANNHQPQERASTFCITGGATGWISKLGIKGLDSHEKFVPDAVFTWNNTAVGAFIRGYFDADGGVNTQSKGAEFSSVSHELLSGVQSLLLRFGIVSSMRIKRGTYKGETHLSWRLQVNGSSIDLLAGIVGATSSKGEALAALVASRGPANDNIDLIPEALLERLRVRRGCRTDKQDGCDLSNRRERGHLRSKVQLLAKKQDRIDLYNESDLFWDEIVNVEFIGDQQTYSVEVDNTHTHITDDFITHNTIQIVGRCVWELGHNHDLRIKVLGSGDEKAKEIIGLIKDIITQSERVHEVFPDLIIDTVRGDTKESFFVVRKIPQRDPSVQASGVMSAGAGGRADLLICDDVVDLKNSVLNPAMREQVIKAVKETWFSLVAATGKIVWICTPYHVADATHDLKNTSTLWKVWWVPAIQTLVHRDEEGTALKDEEGNTLTDKKILWPSKWSEEKLAEKREEVGERVFARQYMLNAMSDEERTFPETSLEKSFDYSIRHIGEDIPNDWPTFGGIDLASALGKKNAYTVIFTVAKNPHNGKVHLKEMWRKRVPFSKTLEAIREQFKKHHWRMAYCENNGYQQAVIDALEESDRIIPLQSFTTGANKANELIGLPGMNVAFEKGLFCIPAATFPLAADDQSDIAVLMTELRTHPGGEFSDTIMALWFAYRATVENASEFEDAYLAAMGA